MKKLYRKQRAFFRIKKGNNNFNKTKSLGIFGSFTSLLGIIGLHNVCHLVCEGLIAFLAIFGIIVVGMPLAFLQNYSFFFSFIGFASANFAISLFVYNKFFCSMKISRKQIFWLIFNFFVLSVSIVGISGNL
ncbi:MAG: hypothetical protein QXQ18_01600 [Candidatus Aenigmatarchaeota archaeon]